MFPSVSSPGSCKPHHGLNGGPQRFVQFLMPGTCEVTFSGQTAMKDLEMSSAWSTQVSPNSSHKCPHKRHRRRRYT